MITKELAREIVDGIIEQLPSIDYPPAFQEYILDFVYRKLLLFLARYTDGYGVNYNDGERGTARQYANANGYFWLPCVICGSWIGGHETWWHSLRMTEGTSVGVCNHPVCREEVQRLNNLYPNGIQHP